VDDGGMGLQDLLERDRKTIDLDRAVAAFGLDDAEPKQERTTTPAAPTAAATAVLPRLDRRARAAAAAAAGGTSSSGSTKAKRIQARRAAAAAAADDDSNSNNRSSSSSDADAPRRCKDAIDRGVAALTAGDADGAVALFTLALELPGNGAFRLPGRAREYSCPSDAEEAAALYNMACAFARKGALDAAAECLCAACDDAGFADWETMLSDPDLEALRGGGRLLGIADERRGAGAAVKGFLSALPRLGGGGDDAGGGAEVKVSDVKGKPWIMW